MINSLKDSQGVQLSKFKQVQGHQRSQIFTNPSSRVLERPKMSSQDIRYNVPSQNYERIRTGGNIGGATAKNPSCDEGNYFLKSSKFGGSAARALSEMHISGRGRSEAEEYGEQRQSNVRFDRGRYSTEPKEISLPYTEYSPSRSSSEYDHPRKTNHRRSSQKYRSAKGDEYSRSPSLHRTKLKSSRTSYSDRSHRSPSTKFGRSPSQRRKGKYEHYQRRSPSPSYSRQSPSPYSRHSHTRAKSKAGRKYSPDKHYEHSSRSHSHRHRSPSRRYRSPSDSSYSSSDSSSSFGRNDSSSEDSSPDRRRRSHRQSHRHERRQRSPPMPKMTVFKGDKTWDSFIFQFERVADRCGWSSRKQAEKLVDCLGGKALEYVRELQLEEDYKRMKRKLAKRFGVKDAPITVRRQLQFLKQEDNETLEEFSQRVHFLVMDGYPGALESTIEQIAVEHFLKGCIDHRAASVAMNKNPTHIHKAVKYTKDAINTTNAKNMYLHQ